MHIRPSFYNIIQKLCCYAKYESLTLKIGQVMAIFAHKGDVKSPFHRIIKSLIKIFRDSSLIFCRRALNLSLNNISIATWSLSPIHH